MPTDDASIAMRAHAMNDMGMLYLQEGKLPEAERWTCNARDLLVPALGEDNVLAIHASGNAAMARMYRSRGEGGGANDLKRALEALRQHGLPESHPWVVKFASALGSRGASRKA
mmetsp:Transcript_11146/g.37780  ORF Transcript_11146/g.37780 Transcript_11146/m.37780 type:complete len:114 (+) Transcript_11146:3-344(+)